MREGSLPKIALTFFVVGFVLWVGSQTPPEDERARPQGGSEGAQRPAAEGVGSGDPEVDRAHGADEKKRAAEVTTPPDKFYVTANALNVRSGPSTRHHVVGQLIRGDLFFVEVAKGEWIRGKRERKNTYVRGWVHRAYLAEEDPLPFLPMSQGFLYVRVSDTAIACVTESLAERVLRDAIAAGGDATLALRRVFRSGQCEMVDGPIWVPQVEPSFGASRVRLSNPTRLVWIPNDLLETGR